MEFSEHCTWVVDHGGGFVGSTIPHKRQQELCGAAPVSRRPHETCHDLASQAPNGSSSPASRLAGFAKLTSATGVNPNCYPSRSRSRPATSSAVNAGFLCSISVFGLTMVNPSARIRPRPPAGLEHEVLSNTRDSLQTNRPQLEGSLHDSRKAQFMS